MVSDASLLDNFTLYKILVVFKSLICHSKHVYALLKWLKNEMMFDLEIELAKPTMAAASTSADHKVLDIEVAQIEWRFQSNGNRWVFLALPPLIQKMTPTQILGGLVFEANLELLKICPSFFRFDVSNLEILKIGGISGISSNYIMLFHNLASTLVHCLSRHQHNWLSRCGLID